MPQLARTRRSPDGDASQLCSGWHREEVHKTLGQRDPAASFILPSAGFDDREHRRRANKAIGVSALGLALTGLVELAIAVLSGSVALLGDALHNLSDVSTSLAVFVGFRVSRKPATERYPYGYERAEDIAGIGIAVVIWASAALAAAESIRQARPPRRHSLSGLGYRSSPGRHPR